MLSKSSMLDLLFNCFISSPMHHIPLSTQKYFDCSWKFNLMTLLQKLVWSALLTNWGQFSSTNWSIFAPDQRRSARCSLGTAITLCLTMLNKQTFLTDCDEALKSKCLHCVTEIFHYLLRCCFCPHFGFRPCSCSGAELIRSRSGQTSVVQSCH